MASCPERPLSSWGIFACPTKPKGNPIWSPPAPSSAGTSCPAPPSRTSKIIRPHFLSQEVLKAYDSGSGGILLAASAKKVPVVTIKSVCFELGNLEQRLSYRRKGLEAMPTIGKIVSRTLLDQGDAI